MVGNKSFLLIIVSLCFWGCTNDATKIVKGEFLCVTDSKHSSDSIYAEWPEDGYFTSPRYIELQYIIHNYTQEKMYIPIQTLSDSTVKSSINVYFMDKTDTIHPYFYVKKSPYNSNYIYKGDSITLFITISQFQKWGNNEIDVSTNLDTLLKKLHVEYLLNLRDVKRNFNIPDIKFGKSPQLYYKIPQDKSILKQVHRDRILIQNHD